MNGLRLLLAPSALVASFLVVACSGGTDHSDLTGASSTSSSGSSGSSTDATEPGGSSSNVSAKAEQTNGACPSRPEELRGTKSAGASCSTFADCKPTCCDCSSGSSYLAAACASGMCAGSEVACARSKQAFCGETTTSSSSGGSSSGGTGKVCVGGTYSSCSGSGMTWTGTECCVDGPVTCTSGTYGSCHGSDMDWTGEVCCVAGSQTCVAGTYSSCYGGAMTWTGAECCLDGPVQCVSGTYSSCYGSGKHWTGALCCIE